MGQGTLFDWIAANAMLPSTDPDPTHKGIQKIDRSTVLELSSIADQYSLIQAKADQCDLGLNPLGLARGVVPFDINPAHLLDQPAEPAKSHFEQIYDRALTALNNTKQMFDYASQYGQMIRSNEDALMRG